MNETTVCNATGCTVPKAFTPAARPAPGPAPEPAPFTIAVRDVCEAEQLVRRSEDAARRFRAQQGILETARRIRREARDEYLSLRTRAHELLFPVFDNDILYSAC